MVHTGPAEPWGMEGMEGRRFPQILIELGAKSVPSKELEILLGFVTQTILCES